MKTILTIILLSAVTCIGAVSKPYLLFIIEADINPAHLRQFEMKVNKKLKNVADDAYSFTNVRYTNTANQAYLVTAMGIAEFAPDATDADIEEIKQTVLPPDRDKIVIVPTDKPFDELNSRGLLP